MDLLRVLSAMRGHLLISFARCLTGRCCVCPDISAKNACGVATNGLRLLQEPKNPQEENEMEDRVGLMMSGALMIVVGTTGTDAEVMQAVQGDAEGDEFLLEKYGEEAWGIVEMLKEVYPDRFGETADAEGEG